MAINAVETLKDGRALAAPGVAISGHRHPSPNGQVFATTAALRGGGSEGVDW